MGFIGEIFGDSLIKNSLYQMATNLSNLILGFFFWVIAARYYTPHDVGTVSAVLSSVFLIAMISSIGFPTALLFYLPRDHKNANNIINSCLSASIAASVVFSLIFLSGLDIWTPSLKPVLGSLELAALFTGVTAASTVSALISGAFIAGRKSSFHMTKETLFGSVKIFPLPLFAVFGGMGIFLSWGTGLILAITLGVILLSRVWKDYSPMFTFGPIIKSMAGYSAGNYLAGIFYSLPRLALPIMIVNMLSAESTGFFFIAMTVAGLLYGIPQSISTSFLAESSEGELWNKVGKAIKFNTALLLPGLLLFALFGKIVLTLFNPSYAQNASTALIVLATASLPMSMVSIFTAVRNAQNRVASVIKINAAIAVITLALSLPLLRSYGIEGAAAAYLAANIIAAVAVIYSMKNPAGFVFKSLLPGARNRGGG